MSSMQWITFDDDGNCIADLVARRASGRLTATTPCVTAPVTAPDPVSGMSVAVHDAKHVLELHGELHHFCAAGCKAAFAADPTRYSRPERRRRSP